MRAKQGLSFQEDESLLAFIHIEKTAGETIKWILRSTYGLNHCDVSASDVFKPLYPYQLDRMQKVYPRMDSIAGHPVTPYMDLEKGSCLPLQYFTFLREPVSQCASYFQYLAITLGIYPSDRFEEWIQTEWPHNMQSKRICGEASAQKAMEMIRQKNIFVGLTERFDESIFFLKTFVRPGLYLGYHQRNIAPSNQLARQLLNDDRTRGLLADAVREDIMLYEWARNEWYPQYAALFAQQIGALPPSSFPFEKQGYHAAHVLINRIYRNLVFRPFETFYARR